MKLRNLILIAGLIIFPFISSAQMAINKSGGSAHASAMLDISSTDKGLLIPRMEITDATSQTVPVLNPADGLIIYNTGSVNVPEGLYVWSCDDTEWVEVILSNNSVYQAMSIGTGGYVMQWGGEINSSTWVIFGGASDGRGSNASAYKTKGFVPRSGEITAFSWSSESANNTSVIAIVIEGVSDTLRLSGVSGVRNLATPISISAGNTIEFKGDSGTDPKQIGILLYIN